MMSEPDEQVQEVRCSVLGKPIPNIPQWMATVKVKFVSNEASKSSSSQYHAPAAIERAAPALRLEAEPDEADADGIEEVYVEDTETETDFPDIVIEGDEDAAGDEDSVEI